MEDEPPVLYEERDTLGIITLNRPEKLNTLNEAVIQGIATTQLLGTLFDGITRHTEEALRWQKSFREIGFRETIRRRDAPFAGYGERPR